jgi:V/A-type H+-transporting ATPase subunit I
MPILPMKFVTIAGPLEEFDEVMKHCVINQEFHPEKTAEVLKDAPELESFSEPNPYAGLLRQAEQLAEQLDIPLEYRSYAEISTELDDLTAYFASVDARAAEICGRRETAQRQISENSWVIEYLQHLKSIDHNLQDLFAFQFCRTRFGRLPLATYQTLLSYLDEKDDSFVFLPSMRDELYVYGVYFVVLDRCAQVDAMFDSVHFERIEIMRAQGTPKEAILKLNSNSQLCRATIQKCEAELCVLRAAEYDTFLASYSYLRYQDEVFNMRRYAAHTKKSFCLSGWVPETDVDTVESRLDETPLLPYVCTAAEEVPELSPPVKLKNPWLAKVYEPFVSMYGLPKYGEADPCLFFAITYTLLFGIMFGDVGHGVVLFLAGLVLTRMGNWLGRIGCCVGVSATAFGFLYGSVFGFEDILPGFKVMEGSNSTSILALTICGGVLLLLASMIMNIANGIRQRDIEKIFFSANGIAGMTLYLALVFGVVGMLFIGWPLLSNPFYVIFLVILPLLLIFFREPLSKKLSGDPDWKPESLGMFLAENTFEMLDVLLPYLTNTLSFLRVGAYAVIHAGMMTVVFALAGESHNIVILILGNLFVMVIEALLVGIQVFRLEFYELFGRFYTGGSEAYSPRIINYKVPN